MNPRLFAASVAVPVLCLFMPSSVAAPARVRELSFAQQVACRTAIERVNYSHRIGATRPFEEALPRHVVEQKVRRFLRDSAFLDRAHPGRITALALDHELERVARSTQMPQRLRELYAALNDDPLLVQECLIRPALVSRLVRSEAGFEEEARMPLAMADERSLEIVAAPSARLPLPIGERASGGPGQPAPCLDDVWSNGILGSHPDPRTRATAVWTGTEMIVWGGAVGGTSVANTGGRYDPSIDEWRPVSTVGAPSARLDHTAVWTGTRMIVWGGKTGDPSTNTGGQYDPATDTWSAMTTVNAPSVRSRHAAVWTGSVMVVWGGGSSYGDPPVTGGGRYDPLNDSWTPIAIAGSPKITYAPNAVWTGSRVLVWGGLVPAGDPDTPYGGQYDPMNDVWSPMSTINEPSHRNFHTAVWSGQEMLVWGGYSLASPALDTGGRYNPATDTWTSIPVAQSTPQARAFHAAVWTGDRMVIWGGRNGSPTFDDLRTGGTFDPATNTWSATSVYSVPLGGGYTSAVWSGDRMLVFGGGSWTANGEGGSYDPSTDSWTRLPPGFSPRDSSGYPRKGVWTGNEFILYGLHEFGYRYDPVLDEWSFVSTVDAPVGYDSHSMVWTGNVVVVWGGRKDDSLTGAINTGGRYDPTTDSWQPTSTIGAPIARINHSAVWTGTQMIVWGGSNNLSDRAIFYNSGGRYDPVLDSWSSMSSAGPAMTQHEAIWTGTRMIVWWGSGGARYDPSQDTWSPMAPFSISDGASAAVWTGSRMIVWGGYVLGNGVTNRGGLYNPTTNTWQVTSLVGAPPGRSQHTAVWTGSHMIVWGGESAAGDPLGDGGRYDPVLDRWTPVSLTNAPHPRGFHVAVWDGAGMIVYDGYWEGAIGWNKGGRYLSSQDADHDGFTACGGDCNDASAAVHPGVAEVCDGVDQDCNQIDDDAPDTDGDGVGACQDCAEGNPQVWRVPVEVANFKVSAALPATFSWDSLASQAGPQIGYDVVTGGMSVAGGFNAATAVCLGTTSTTAFSDARPGPAANAGYWYLIGGRNSCGRGTLGTPQRDAVGLGLCP